MQKQTYHNLIRNRAQFQSVTGYSPDFFDALFIYFKVHRDTYITRYTIAGKERRRPPRVYKNKVFADTRDMLVFILYYLKNNCLQESLATMFGMNQPQANLWIHLLKDILLKSLESSHSLPCRDFESLHKLIRHGQELFIDGSERPVPRPVDCNRQKELYSGKKNAYRKKYIHYIAD